MTHEAGDGLIGPSYFCFMILRSSNSQLSDISHPFIYQHGDLTDGNDSKTEVVRRVVFYLIGGID
jgi:hypothetical protein